MATSRRITRSKPAPARESSRSSAPARRGRVSGAAEGRAQYEVEKQQAKERQEASRLNAGMPFRFFTPDGETREVVVLDSEPTFFRHEHALENKESGRFDRFFECIAGEEECPVCEVDQRRPYYAMFLTILDLTPYESKGETIPHSKKLMVVKPKQQEKIFRLLDREKDLRGAILLMTRDGKMDASIGGDIELDGFMDEAEIVEHEYEYEDREGKVHAVDMEPYDYEEMFPEPTAKQLEAAVGTGGSRRGNRSADRDEVARPTRTAARRGRSTGDEAPPAEEPEEEAPVRGRGRGRAEPVEEEPPARGRIARGRSREEPAEEADERPSRRIATTRGRAAAAEEADADGADDGADEAPAERTTRRRAVEASPRSRGRPEADDPPFEGGRTVRGRGRAAEEPEPEVAASRRSALRRGARG